MKRMNKYKQIANLLFQTTQKFSNVACYIPKQPIITPRDRIRLLSKHPSGLINVRGKNETIQTSKSWCLGWLENKIQYSHDMRFIWTGVKSLLGDTGEDRFQYPNPHNYKHHSRRGSRNPKPEFSRINGGGSTSAMSTCRNDLEMSSTVNGILHSRWFVSRILKWSSNIF